MRGGTNLEYERGEKVAEDDSRLSARDVRISARGMAQARGRPAERRYERGRCI
jgi:hypothetical protein